MKNIIIIILFFNSITLIQGQNNSIYNIFDNSEIEKSLNELSLCQSDSIKLFISNIQNCEVNKFFDTIPYIIDPLKVNTISISYIPNLLIDYNKISIFENLEYLEIYNNQFCNSKNDLCRFIRLKYLNISGCNINELINEIVKLSSLESLNLIGSGLKYIPDSIINLKNLKKLEIDNVTKFNIDIISKMKIISMVLLISDKNKSIKGLEKIKTLEDLTILNSFKKLNYKKQNTIFNILKELPNLKDLTISDFGEFISDDINLLQSLHTIYFNTKINNIEIIKLPHLEKVIIPRNNFNNPLIKFDKLKKFKFNNPKANIFIKNYNNITGRELIEL